MTVPANVSTLLFGGIRPPNGFMVQPYGYNTGCVINDNGAASMNPPYSGCSNRNWNVVYHPAGIPADGAG